MADKPMSITQRKRRVARDAVVLAVCVVFLFAAWGFPIFTAEQAMKTTQRRYFFGPGEVIGMVDYVGQRGSNTVWMGKYDRYYILRDGDWYAWCGVNHYGLFWQTGGLEAVENDPSVPLVPLIICHWGDGAVLMVCNDPDIAEVELIFPSYDDDIYRYRLYSFREDERTEDCFIVPLLTATSSIFGLEYELLVRGYNAAGEIIYQSPIPNWEEDYGLSLEKAGLT